MTPEERFEALAAADAIALESLADDILAQPVAVSVVDGPESVSAPVRIPGEGETTAVLGHVALTRCTVLLGGARGDGIRVGYDLTGAVSAAICDAECERDGPLSIRVHDLCEAAGRARAEKASARARLVDSTRLDKQ